MSSQADVIDSDENEDKFIDENMINDDEIDQPEPNTTPSNQIQIKSKDQLQLIISAQNIATLYHSLAKLDKNLDNKSLYDALDKVVVEYINEFPFHWLSNIFNTKTNILGSHDIDVLIQGVTEYVENHKLTHLDLVSLKLIIYSMSKVKPKSSNLQFTELLVNEFIKICKFIKSTIVFNVHS